MKEASVGEVLIQALEKLEVKFIFGIPGVHTVELYRALSESTIRHITARHEQALGFMADGYSRISGKPGVCFVITGPGLTNILTAMAQARSDSIPMLVISGVNELTKNKYKGGRLHELPNQTKLIKQVAIATYTVKKPENVMKVLHKAFLKMTHRKPGPVHVQIPIDVMTKPVPTDISFSPLRQMPIIIDPLKILQVSKMIKTSRNPYIIIGGGARDAKAILKTFVEKIGATAISTVNARDLLGNHDFHIPASPSLNSVRALLDESDLVIALGTEIGQTDFDMFEDGLFPDLKNLIRVDIDKNQLKGSPPHTLNIQGDINQFCISVLKNISLKTENKNRRSIAQCKNRIELEISTEYKSCQLLISTIVKALPDSILVGDSTQPIYFGNLYCKITSQNRWFNSATGFGTLGYAPPASIGASLACPEKPVICIVGDGGLQFTISELGTAIDENTPVLFLIWNNNEYKEIRTYMESKKIKPIGVSPKPPNLQTTAKSYDIKYHFIKTSSELSKILLQFQTNPSPLIIEINENKFSK